MWLGALSGVVVVLGFTIVHNLFIVDIWFNAGPMLFAGALCGSCIVWSYRKGVADHSTAAWFRYAGFFAVEVIALGAVSLAVLRPQFTMAELLVADDAFEQADAAFGAAADRRDGGGNGLGLALLRPALGGADSDSLVTHVLVVFLLGHQFAFLGLVESSSALLVVFGEFALFTVGLTAAFCLGVVWSMVALKRLQSSS